MPVLAIPHCSLDDACAHLRAEVRAFLADALAGRSARQRAENWDGYDADFSRQLGARGWLGMTWPKQYGGHERSALERYVVIEELLAAGAPVAAHWIGDRQSGPLLLRYASARIRDSVLPGMTRGETYFCIGMSEPDTGSDLASLRSRADAIPDDQGGGWRLNGTKLWTTNAHHAHYMLALLRTDAPGDNRHAGLSQFLIDLSLPGVTIRPIRNLVGAAHFNEVVFEDVRVAPDCLIGPRGNGWAQVNAELSLERSGPERYLSSIQLLKEMIAAADPDAPNAPGNRHQAIVLGRLTAEMATLRQMSLGIAGMLARGENPALLAAIVKDQGAMLEQKIPELAHELYGGDAALHGSDLQQVLTYLQQVAPSFSLRGGTREILRGIIAKGLGLR